MPLTVTCPGCHRTFRVADHHAGRRGLCPDCGEVVGVPRHELERLDPEDDEPEIERRPARRRLSPRDHLSEWRGVATGFLIQQFGAALLLLGIGLLMVGAIVLADDAGDFQKEPNPAQAVAAGIGCLALFVGLAGQAVGRLLAARTPVRAPRALSYLAATASGAQLVGGCLIGMLMVVHEANVQQGNPPDEAVESLGGLGALAWMFLVVGGEAIHCLAIACVGRVLGANGARAMGNALTAYVVGLGLLALFAFCGLAMWVGTNNPQNPDLTDEQTQGLFVWLAVAGAVTGLYVVLDIVLLQQARSAVAGLAEGRDDPDT